MKHLAGVIPVSGIASDINSPVGPALLPISLNYLAIERAVTECAYAGCDTIWIVCDDDTTPLIRYALGDLVYDPIYVNRTRAMFPLEYRRFIKIYYVPVGSRFYKQKNVWLSILSGCLTSKKISAGMSKWLKPTKYYVSFPCGVYDPTVLKQHRSIISSDKNIYLSCAQQSALSNHFLGISFTPGALDLAIKKYSHDRYNDRPLRMFEDIDGFHEIEIEKYVSVIEWPGYLESLKLSLTSPGLIPKKELNGLAVDD